MIEYNEKIPKSVEALSVFSSVKRFDILEVFTEGISYKHPP